MMRTWLLLAILFLPGGPLLANAVEPTVPDLHGQLHRPFDIAGEGAVIVFILHDCPISNAYAPELSRLAILAREKNLAFYLVHADVDAKDALLQQHAKEYGYTCTVLADRKRALVKRLGATVAPQAFLIDSTGKTVYQGRIDDLYAGFGKKRVEPTQRDLRDALEAMLTGKPIANPKTPAIGCSIE